VISITFIANLYSKAKENNVFSGIIIFDIIAFLSYVVNPISFYYAGDIDLIFGGIVALLFALKNRKEHQTALKIGFYVGLFGAILSAVSISVFEWFFFIVYTGFVLGLVIGYIYHRKNRKSSKSKSNSKYTDEYLEKLLKK
jgi:cadmium resistance protein CadD (predicted permease)